MSNVPQAIIDELAKVGVVPGATVTNTFQGTFVVTPYDQWESASGVNWYCVPENFTGRAWIYKGGRCVAAVITPATQSQPEGLKEGDACELPKDGVSFVLELAKELGLNTYRHGAGVIDGLRYGSGQVMTAGDMTTWAQRNGGDGLNIILPEAFIAKMRVTAAQPKPITIGDHSVDFMANGDVKVGCTRMDFATLEAVYNEAKKHRP